MGRYKKHLIKILVCFCLVYTPFFANASSNVGGWSMGNPVASGASAVYTGTKNVIINGADYIKKGTAKITPTASQVAKVLRGGVAGYALSIAVEQLIGSVDWVLDPANNRVVWTVDGDAGPDPTSTKQYCWRGNGQPSTTCYATMQQAATPECGSWGAATGDFEVHESYAYAKCANGRWATLHKRANTIYDPTAEPEDKEKSIPLDVVAQQVISNAQGGDTNAQVATMAAAADIVDEASKDDAKARPIVDQLNNSSSTSPANSDANANANIGSGSVANPNTADPDAPPLNITLKFPIFCNWAPSVCEAAQVVISFPQTLTSWWETATTSITEAWTAVKEWATAEPETTDTELDIPEEDQEATDTNISFDNSCPAPISVPVSWNGNTIHFDFSFDMFCQSFGTYVKPIIIALGAFHAVLIVSGVRINE